MRTLLQISDTHFGTEQQPVLDALLTLSHRISPDVVVVSGDITQRARRVQFSVARAFTEQLQARHILAIPGNHDIPLFNLFARYFYPYANYARAFGANLEPVFEDEDALVICVNTTRPSRHKDGEVSEQQIQHVAKRLSTASKRQLRIVVTHQPVHVIDAHDIPNLLHGRDAAVRAWSNAGVDIIMGGHIHLPHMRPLADGFVDLPRAAWSIQAGTAVSHRTRSGIPNSVNVITTAFPTCVVERWDFNAADSAFVCKETHSLELARD
jgi:3',5'-cyclic AMP phosphodiesterase CpdA